MLIAVFTNLDFTYFILFYFILTTQLRICLNQMSISIFIYFLHNLCINSSNVIEAHDNGFLTPKHVVEYTKIKVYRWILTILCLCNNSK
jgi:hypothetical protein